MIGEAKLPQIGMLESVRREIQRADEEPLCLLLCLRRFLLCIRRCRLSSVLFSLVVVIVPIVRDDADGYANEVDRSQLWIHPRRCRGVVSGAVVFVCLLVLVWLSGLRR